MTTTKQFFDYYDLEAYLGGRREAREYDTIAISEEVSHVDPTDGNRYWKPEVDEDTLFKIAERHHTGRRFLKEELGDYMGSIDPSEYDVGAIIDKATYMDDTGIRHWLPTIIDERDIWDIAEDYRLAE
jgi:hypothetical protein